MTGTGAGRATGRPAGNETEMGSELTWLRIKSVHTWAERSWDNHWIHAPEDGIHFKDRFRPSDASMAPGVTENHPRNVPSLQLYLQYGNFGNRLKGQWE